MGVQTDLRAGGRCHCGYTFYFLNDWDVHILTVNGNGAFNHYRED